MKLCWSLGTALLFLKVDVLSEKPFRRKFFGDGSSRVTSLPLPREGLANLAHKGTLEMIYLHDFRLAKYKF